MSNLDLRAATEYFVYDGTPSYDFKCLVFPAEVDSAPEKQYQAEAIPGRDGDILLSSRRFSNVQHSYDCIIYEDFDYNFANLREYLLSRDGYCRLEDTIHNDEYYHAYITTVETPYIRRQRDMGKFRLTFTRKPQRYLKSGDVPISFITHAYSESFTVVNPTRFPCAPLIFAKGDKANYSGDPFTSAGGQPYFEIREGGSSSVYTKIKILQVTKATSNVENYGLYIDMDLLQMYAANQTMLNEFVSYDITHAEIPYHFASGTNALYMYHIANYPIRTLQVTPRWYRI